MQGFLRNNETIVTNTRHYDFIKALEEYKSKMGLDLGLSSDLMAIIRSALPLFWGDYWGS